MKKAGGIVALIAGVFGIFAAVITLFLGGLGSAFKANGAGTVVGLGWGGVFFSFLVIVLGAIAISAKSKAPSIFLIISSIAGAVLGGTIVAIFMGLALVGGILAVIGTKKETLITAESNPSRINNTLNQVKLDISPSVNDQLPVGNIDVKSTKSKKLVLGILAALSIVAVSVLVTLAVTKQHGENDPVAEQKEAAPPNDPLVNLANAEPENIDPTGELARIYDFGSKYTDLQRDKTLEQIKGKVIVWLLKVYDVTKDGDEYKIQTSGTNSVDTFIRLTPRSEEEIKYIENLKTDDPVLIKGVIADTRMRNLVIEPAILWKNQPDAADPKSIDKCANLPKVTDKLVCSSAELTALDAQFTEEASTASDFYSINIALLKGLRAKCNDVGCLKQYYTTAIESVRDMKNNYGYGKEDANKQTAAVAKNENPPSTNTTTNNAVDATANSESFSPSFDCQRATSRVEKLICSDKELSKLDVEMFNVYQEAKKVYDPNMLKSNQRAWLKQREQCVDTVCVKNVYEQAINTYTVEMSELKSGL